MVGFVVLGAVALLALMIVAARALTRMPNSDAPAPAELVGALGTVVTPIPDDGIGEITVTSSGSSLKVNAVAETSIENGATVVVIDTDSPTSVVVAQSGF